MGSNPTPCILLAFILENTLLHKCGFDPRSMGLHSVASILTDPRRSSRSSGVSADVIDPDTRRSVDDVVVDVLRERAPPTVS